MRFKSVLVALVLLASLPAQAKTNAELKDDVWKTEQAFAKTMADRDFAAFLTFLAEETIFFGRQPAANRGKETVAKAWKPFYEPAQAPFSWEPEAVEVLDSGTLAMSSGPVRDPSGRRIGTYNSIWRLEKDGRWRIIFDKGCPPCESQERPAPPPPPGPPKP